MRKPLIVGNWKMNNTTAESVDLTEKLKRLIKDMAVVEVVVAPPFTSLDKVRDAIKGSNIKLGAQNLFWEDKGAYTGEVSPLMIRDLDCEYVIIGHSERREYFKESDEIINKKIKAALRNKLKAIVCVGESLKEREEDKTMQVIESQVKKGLQGLSLSEAKELIIAYEPVWAIGTGRNATPAQANEVHTYIRKLLSQIFNEGIASNIKILYGGSVKPSNSAELMSEKEIDGALVGGASLEADSFAEIVRSACMV
ncbi:MAG: triose-phosphate isomerase [Nitrospinae bacterium RIFCSPLOWO2_12_39_16]|nr:MAG: triose-phosphate isomerase [Nitrospinae bacterium RIFCSPLOWO2_12_39_16]HLA48414.1 triose-phosphate isomerase [Nitrospinota bacterium]